MSGANSGATIIYCIIFIIEDERRGEGGEDIKGNAWLYCIVLQFCPGEPVDDGLVRVVEIGIAKVPYFNVICSR